MQERIQIVSILFSDIESYSSVQENHLILEIDKFNEEIINHILTDQNHIYHNTWGDAFFICSYNPIDMANIALDIRDKFRNKNWLRIGFKNNIRVRIGLHTEKVNIAEENGIIKRVSGFQLTSTARIEPIVEPNHIYCSEFFYKHLVKEKDINFKFENLGIKKLAKEFGEEPLYELLRDYESLGIPIENGTFKFPKIKVKKNITDKELNDYLKQTFTLVQEYFEKASFHLQKENPQIETSISKTENELNIELYQDGKYKTNCKVWFGDEHGSKQIFYSEGKSFGSQTSYNECIYIEYDGFEVSFRPLMGFHLGNINKEKLEVPEKVAEYLWTRFIQPLTY